MKMEAYPNRDKAIMAGYFLSKFDKMALDEFGFSGFMQAYNVLGYALGVVPLSIKAYRDEFDPYFPNPRKGWVGRKLRDYCRDVMKEVEHLSFEDFCEIIKAYTIPNYDLERLALEKKSEKKSSFASRLITGRAAEEYFVEHYKQIDPFCDFEAQDTTMLGCGFDFKLSRASDFYCVEVKGLGGKNGSIMMTEKEFNVADSLRNQFCLFVVSNFAEKPEHTLVFNPLESRLDFVRKEQQITQVSYTTLF